MADRTSQKGLRGACAIGERAAAQFRPPVIREPRVGGGASRSAGLVRIIRWGEYALSGGGREIEQGLPGQLRRAGIGMPEQQDQHSDPAKLMGFDSDHRNGFIH